MSTDKWIPNIEADMSEPITAYFESKNGLVYGEIFDKRGIIDHVVKTPDNELIAVEMKLSFNFQLLFQAYKNTWYCDYSYLVFPFCGKYLQAKSAELAKIKYICEALGIGILKYGRRSRLNENYKHGDVYISEWLKPKKNKPKWKNYLLKKLIEEKLNQKGGVRYTSNPRRKKHYRKRKK